MAQKDRGGARSTSVCSKKGGRAGRTVRCVLLDLDGVVCCGERLLAGLVGCLAV
jgi:hypothetical protein